ncbi:MAG: AAA family ATPase [Planctomycetales bacterium]|nr:AAA family ATPase [Planctomycetales bacterium]
MPPLILDALPPKTTRGTIVRLLIQVGGLEKDRIGAIRLEGRRALVEVPERYLAKLVRALDGTSLDNRHIRASSEGTPAERTSGDEDHFERLLRLSDIEAREEARQTLEAARKAALAGRGSTETSLAQLAIRDAYAGLGGRVLVVFGPTKPDTLLPWHRLTVGTPVLLSEEGVRKEEGVRGIVARRAAREIEVALPFAPDSDAAAPTWRLDLSTDELGRQRQRAALERARSARGERLAELREVLIGGRNPELVREPTVLPADDSLNASQRDAVELALNSRDVSVIHGPPGTGKTTTVAALIRACVARDETVLACAPSNMGVDNLLEKLLAQGIRAIRLGHPARVLPVLREHTLDLLVEAHPDVKLARKLAREANALFDKSRRYTRSKPAPGAKQEMRAEAKAMQEDARRIEAQVVGQLLDGAQVLCATLNSLDSSLIGQRQFDLAVIDEACQSTEPACWIPLLRCQRLVLAGDHCQLPPVILSREAEREGLGISLLERMVSLFGSAITRRLETQYRMHEAIMRFSSRAFYDDALAAHASVAAHRLCDLPEVKEDELTSEPLTFIDTAGAGYDEEQEEDGESRLNRQEAELAWRKAEQLLAAGIDPADLAIIAPYAAQVRLLRDLRTDEAVEIDSVDGFQGREKEAIIISLVRSNPTGEIGFLGDVRRMNVALTRARRKLIVIGDSATIGGHEFYRELLDYFETAGAYRSVWEEAS